MKKERQRRGKRKQESGAAVSKPKELSVFNEEEESTTKSVGHILKHLKLACSESGKPVHYFTFLVDPHSFPRTVENLFHFSFLVKVSCVYSLCMYVCIETLPPCRTAAQE